MIYNLSLPYIAKYHLANLMHYITFRSGLAVLISLLWTLFFIPKVICYLNYKRFGQPVRDIGLQNHKIKAGIPNMGGIAIIGSIVITSILLMDLTNHYLWILIFVLLSFGFLGLADDYLKVIKKNHYGVSGKVKLLVQFSVSIVACVLVQHYALPSHANIIVIPFFKNIILNLGYLYLPFTAIVITAASNAVNLTDGLDGLVIVPTAILAICLAIICYLVGHSFYAEYLQIIYVPHVGELAIVCAAIVGSCLGFLWYNCQPAEIFMGDTGSLALGSILGVISVIAKHELVLAIIGGLFVIEALSVIIQVYYFKISGGKRVFRMAPLHHHFEQLGWPESKVVIRMWIVSIVFALIGLSSLKLR